MSGCLFKQLLCPIRFGSPANKRRKTRTTQTKSHVDRIDRGSPPEKASKNSHTKQETTIVTSSNTHDVTLSLSSTSFDQYGIPHEVFERECANDELSMMSCSIIIGTSERWVARDTSSQFTRKEEAFEEAWMQINDDDDFTLDFTRVSIWLKSSKSIYQPAGRWPGIFQNGRIILSSDSKMEMLQMEILWHSASAIRRRRSKEGCVVLQLNIIVVCKNGWYT